MLTIIIQGFYDAFIILAELFVNILPESPFRGLIESDVLSGNRYTGILSLFIPFGMILAAFQAWLSAIVLWYVVKVILRWVKVIR